MSCCCCYHLFIHVSYSVYVTCAIFLSVLFTSCILTIKCTDMTSSSFFFDWWLFFSFPWLSQDCVQQHFFVPSISWVCYIPPFPIPLSAFFALSFNLSPGVIAPRNLLYVNLFPGHFSLCTFPFLLFFSKEKRIQLYDLKTQKWALFTLLLR